MISWLILVVLCAVLLWKLPAPKRKLWAFLFLYKLVFLWLFFWVHQRYYAHYQWDFWLIFLDACQLNDLFWRSPNDFFQTFFLTPTQPEKFYFSEQPRAFFTAKLYFPFVVLAQKNWLLSSLYAILLYLIALYVFIQTLQQILFRQKLWIYVLMFLPSLQFWTSGTSKEIWLMICIYSIIALHLQVFYLQKALLSHLFIAVILFFILWKVKYYYAFGIAFFLLAERLIFFWQNEKISPKVKWTATLIALVLLTLLPFLHTNLHLENFPEALYENYRITLQASPKDSAVGLGLDSTWTSCLINSYKGTWIALFAPLPWQATNLNMALASVENTLFLVSLVFSLWISIQRLLRKKERKSSFFWASLLFVLLMATFLGLSSPNFGALSRYRIGFSWLLWVWITWTWEKFFCFLKQSFKPQRLNGV
ncbi:MAG: hypothetical protein NZ516_02915 [Raineya sp.]|nr:hypothetical protein [Raineya sp.]